MFFYYEHIKFKLLLGRRYSTMITFPHNRDKQAETGRNRNWNRIFGRSLVFMHNCVTRNTGIDKGKGSADTSTLYSIVIYNCLQSFINRLCQESFKSLHASLIADQSNDWDLPVTLCSILASPTSVVNFFQCCVEITKKWRKIKEIRRS